MTFLLILASALAGFAALAASMRKYGGDWGPARHPRGQRLLRLAGWTLLVTGLGYAMAVQSSAVGIVLWFATATVAVPPIALLLGYRKMRRRK